MVYYEKSFIAMQASIIGAVVNIILNFIFIPIFGYIAAGYTTVFCNLIFVVMHYRGMKKVLDEQGISENVYDIKMIIAISAIMFVFTALVLFLYKNIVLRYFVIAFVLIMIFIFRKKIIKTISHIKKK